MNGSTPSPEVRQFFVQELQEDGNATLQLARDHLRDLCEAAPGDTVSRQHQWLAEVDELLVSYDEHTPLSNFVPKPL